MSNLTSILVLGAGELGLPVIRALSSQTSRLSPQPSLSVLLRPLPSAVQDPQKQKQAAELQGLGCRIIRHDVGTSTADDLAHVFAEFDAVVACTGWAGGLGTQVKITQAVIAAKVKRYIRHLKHPKAITRV